MSRNHKFGSPSFDKDILFGHGGLVDRLSESPIPWKILKAFAPEEDGVFQPSLDIKSCENDYVICAEIPGISKDKVKLEILEGYLVLSGEKSEESQEGEVKHVSERRFGAFERKIALPEDADSDNISAKHKDGLLIITIPKISPKNTHKTITIS